jgi:hypothetical protein
MSLPPPDRRSWGGGFECNGLISTVDRSLCNTIRVKMSPSVHQIAANGLRFFLHLIVSALGVPIASAVLAYAVLLPLHQFFPSVGSRTVHWILTETPYFPVQILVGFMQGFQLGRRYGHRVMLWTWIVPALAIALAMLFAPLRPVLVSGVQITGVRRFFGWACLPQNHCYEQVALTIPFYSASAYSLGAFVARRTLSSKEETSFQTAT